MSASSLRVRMNLLDLHLLHLRLVLLFRHSGLLGDDLVVILVVAPLRHLEGVRDGHHLVGAAELLDLLRRVPRRDATTGGVSLFLPWLVFALVHVEALPA